MQQHRAKLHTIQQLIKVFEALITTNACCKFIKMHQSQNRSEYVLSICLNLTDGNQQEPRCNLIKYSFPRIIQQCNLSSLFGLCCNVQQFNDQQAVHHLTQERLDIQHAYLFHMNHDYWINV